MGHTCKAIVIHCMDFRFGKSLFAFLTEKGLLGKADIVGWAGAGKPCCDGEQKHFPLTQIGLSKQLHHIQEVHVIQHIDCGAYGGSAVFAGKDQELAFQISELQKIKKSIVALYPDLTLHGYIAELQSDGDVQVTEMELA